MKLRTKLILLLSTIVISVAVSASATIYSIAYHKLEVEAEKRLLNTADMLASAIQRRIDEELRKVEYWAAMPMVVQTARKSYDAKQLEVFRYYFSHIVSREPFHSFFILDWDGECVASDDPRRIGHPYPKKHVRNLASAKAAFAGKANIGLSLFSLATGRPIVPLTAPVWHRGKVISILRTSIDMGRLSRQMLTSYDNTNRIKAYIYDPDLPLSLPKGSKLHTPKEQEPYRPPPEELRMAHKKGFSGVFHYVRDGREYLAASVGVREPAWYVVVSQPMSEVISPVKALRQYTAAVTVLTLFVLVVSVLLLTGPTVRAIEMCRRFAADISRGHLNRRMELNNNDEVGQLARDLNQMAATLQENHRALTEAELKYRRIFENAVEGIFQTDNEGKILAANPRLAALLGVSSPDEIVGHNAETFYIDSGKRDEIKSLLQEYGEISDYSFEIRRRDGEKRQVVLHAHVQLDPGGNIEIIDGILEDATELRRAEARAARARDAEELLLRTELEVLRYQVNPHFLFNTLNSIRELVLSSPQAGVEMIESLASFYHACLLNRSKSLSTVAEELARITWYLQIQKVRFGDRLQVEIEAGQQAKETPIPAFIVQPLVENAVKYGQKSGIEPLTIKISAKINGSDCILAVSNSGRWFGSSHTKEGDGSNMGLEYVKRCMDHYYGTDADLSLSEDQGYVVVRIAFPTSTPWHELSASEEG